ncbi:serine protease [Actinocatenispora sera]|uniref:trypsin-like serine peptidase n=1 Tax=Actinocatenispora sera TaxID=390989 RepID=UPI0033C59640
MIAVLAVLLGGLAVACGSHHPPRPSGAAGGPWSGPRMRSASPFGTPGVQHTARPTLGAARVGAVFSDNGAGGHFCTASIVDSPGDSVILTAAHCVHAGRGGHESTDLVFVPGYRDGDAPYGEWSITHVVVDRRWVQHSDPDYDVAFADVATVHGRRVGDVFGGNTLGYDRGYRLRVQITGYPASTEQPITCGNETTKFSAGQLRIECAGFPGGTSGGPWVTDLNRETHTGTVIGVIGGYQAGGATPDVSYSPYFGAGVLALYRTAVRDEH